MKYIFIDFEMHPLAKEFKQKISICPREIIEIGAVMLDENYSEVSSFKRYVKPQYVTKIHTQVSALTGITQNTLSGESSFEKVLNELISWCNPLEDDIQIYAWSESDLLQFTREMNLKNIPITKEIQTLLDNWIDFQKDYSELIQSDHPLALNKALSLVGTDFSGKMHDALFDARNTAELFVMTQDRDSFFKTFHYISDIIDNSSDEVSTFKLSDIFNFDLVQVSLA